ncbi:hypothetical protein FJT64_025897 [Amphibalanus amphitrite]|uniref:Mab-21-like HhH/H2TH-like domain-containing protein n=1 Tax=Amphibalanus amphitrite TaxID=1232801 RepID=A0A6A4WJ37_AMPAM|nr:hypothetical protein FJT64_025897 [Amphibalanus amphitrite]
MEKWKQRLQLPRRVTKAVEVDGPAAADTLEVRGQEQEVGRQGQEVSDRLAALSLSVDQSRLHEQRLGAVLRGHFRLEPSSLPIHLKYIRQVLAPKLQRDLNAQLSALGRDATLPTDECGRCGGLPADGLRVERTTISGSVADRVGWITINRLKLVLHSDHDFMLELNVSAAPLAAEAASGASEPCLAPSDTPGFYRLLLGRSAECRHPQRRELPAAAVRAAMTAAVRGHCAGAEPRVSGPAVTFDDGQGDVDCVSCVPVRCEAAVPWLAELRARPRPAGWPGERLLARLAGPLHLVPVGPGAADRRLWRLSFSGPESLLVRALPARARYCLLLLRLVRAHRRQQLATVSSYYLKTCVFWLCQWRPEADWQEPLAAIRAVLAMLEEAIDQGFLPCFFWSEMNVFREPTPERLAALRFTVRRFQEDLVHILYTLLNRTKKVWGLRMIADQD